MDAELFNQITTFYDNSWNKLIFVISTLFIFIGIIFPLIIQFMQRRSNIKERNEIKQSINLEVKNSLGDSENKIIDVLEKKLEEKYLIRIEQLERKYEIALGHSFLLQANFYSSTAPITALGNYIFAMNCYIMGKDEANLKRILATHKTFKENVNIDDFIADSEYVETAKLAIQNLEGINENNRYTDDIRELRKYYKKIIQ